jgi:ATP-binding cassette subfamily F protein uup
VVVVSHDRYFLNRICDGILALEGNEEIYYSEGGYDFYIKKKKNREQNFTESKQKENNEDSRIRNKQKKLSYKDSLELAQIEEKIMQAESEVEEIEKIYSSPDFFEKYASQTNELNLKLDKAKEKVKELYIRWDELESLKSSL